MCVSTKEINLRYHFHKEAGDDYCANARNSALHYRSRVSVSPDHCPIESLTIEQKRSNSEW